jgi:cyclic pyranopterin phosphate synthase
VTLREQNNKMSEFSHLNENNNPKMVNVSDKKITKRTATAKASMFLGKEVISHFTNDELITKKGPVFQTAIIAGIQAVKKTSELIPMCHPLLINGVDIDITILDSEHVEVLCKVVIEGKTGVEMEALTGVNIACLTIYDMCKSISQKMLIKEVRLMEKTGGKSDIKQ